MTCSKGIPRFHIPVNQQMYSAQKTGSLFRTESSFDSPRHFVCCTVSVCLQYEKYYFDSDCEDTKLGIIDIPVEILINYIYSVYSTQYTVSILKNSCCPEEVALFSQKTSCPPHVEATFPCAWKAARQESTQT